jgi:predicted enzyme related to lactoylglutathione lyase
VFSLDGEDVGGMMGLVPQMGPEARPHWSTWFTVDDVDETARRASALGGKLCVAPHDIPDIGRFCAIASPQGIPFHAITWRR